MNDEAQMTNDELILNAPMTNSATGVMPSEAMGSRCETFEGTRDPSTSLGMTANSSFGVPHWALLS
jgi:hypothetical protein